MCKGLSHAAYVVSDMEKALDFYVGKLGLEVAFTMDNDKGEPWIVYLKLSNGSFIELFYGGTKTVEFSHQNIGFTHICIEVEDIDQIADFVRSKGVELDVEPKTGKDTNRQCWVHDPDGNRIEFMQLMPGSPQLKSN